MRKQSSARYALLLCLYLLGTSTSVGAAPNTGSPLTLTWSGFIFDGMYLDNRQVFGTREDIELHVPQPYLPDIFGRDINDKGQWCIVPLYSRINLTIDGPVINGAKSGAFFETDFYGSSDDFRGDLRARKAFMTLDWAHFSFLCGLSDHPFTFPIRAPNTITPASGTPIASTSVFDTQLRFHYHTDTGFDAMFFMLSQLYDKSPGPIGYSTTYARNAIVPNLHLYLHKQVTQTVALSTGLDYKRLIPRLVSDLDIRVHESINSMGIFVCLEIENDAVYSCTKSSYAQNADNLDMLGGYAVHCIDPATHRYTYTNFQTIGTWTDLTIKGDREWGIFLGVEKNLGFMNSIILTTETPDEEVVSLVYGFGNEVDILIRVSPRARFHFDRFTLGLELEYNYARWGVLTTSGKVTDTKGVNNLRLFLGFQYDF